MRIIKKVIAIMVAFAMIMTLSVINTHASEPVDITYQAHVSNIGWMKDVKSGVTAGTTGQSKALEAIKITSTNNDNLSFEAQNYNHITGWSGVTSTGDIIGTTGKSRPMEAIRIKLKGTEAGLYKIYYRVHVSNIGWLDWASDNQLAGSSTYNNIEAIQIKVLPADEPAPGSTTKPFATVNNDNDIHIEYRAHSQNVGWQKIVGDSSVAGTTGKGYRLEALQAKVVGNDNLGIQYQTHVSNIGWQTKTNDGQVAGTTGKRLAIEAINMKLIGSEAQNYSIYYRAHVGKIGWLGWAKDGNNAGSTGQNLQVEAIQIQVVKSGDQAPGTTSNALFESPTYSYSVNVEGDGWSNDKTDGVIAGTTGQSKRVELFKASIENSVLSGTIQYRGHIQNVGWDNWASNNQIIGKSGSRLEAIQVKLTGSISALYDIYYRVHAQKFGWLGWAKNGESAGTQGYGYRIEAIEIKIYRKTATKPVTGYGFKQYQSITGSWVKKLAEAKTADTIITVNQASGSNAILQVHKRSGNNWTIVYQVSCRLGSNGLSSNRHEGDRTTPRGTWKIGNAFGIANNPGCPTGYHKVTKYDYWIASNNAYYNKMIDTRYTNVSITSKDEHLISYTTAYQYCLDIGFNKACTKGLGSAIFLHCQTSGATAGCVSVPKSSMIWILQHVTSNTYMHIE